MPFLKKEDDVTLTVEQIVKKNETRLQTVKNNNEMTVTHSSDRIFIGGPSYITNYLPVGYYIFNFENEKYTYWIEPTEAPHIPEKVYDFYKNTRENIIKVFSARDNNLGILFKGDKGTGKTIQAKLICRDLNLPVIIIDKRIPIEVDLLGFLRKIKQDYILFIDEFEKIFDKYSGDDYHSQDTFLSFLDGATTNGNKVASLLTCNNSVSEFFINRPGRIRYLLNFDTMPESAVDEVIADKLIYKEFESDLRNNIDIKFINIDLLSSIIEEINILKKPFSEIKDYFNGKKTVYMFEVENVDDDGDVPRKTLMFSDQDLKPGAVLRDNIHEVYARNIIQINASLKKLSNGKYQMKSYNSKKSVIFIKEAKL